MTHDVAEDVDIYSDLSTVNFSDIIKKLETSNKELSQQVKHLEHELSGAVEEKKKLEARCQTLSFNISSLFKTAQSEVNRKDKTISELRSEINNVLFRRNTMGSSWSFRKYQEKVEVSASTPNDPKSRQAENNDPADERSRKSERCSETRNRKDDIRGMDVQKPSAEKSVNTRVTSSRVSRGHEKEIGKRAMTIPSKKYESSVKSNLDTKELIKKEKEKKKRGETSKLIPKSTDKGSTRSRCSKEASPKSRRHVSERTSRSLRSQSSQQRSQNNVSDDKCNKQTDAPVSSIGNSVSSEINSSSSVDNEALTTVAQKNNSASSDILRSDSAFGPSDPPVMTEYSRRMLRRIKGIPPSKDHAPKSNLNSCTGIDKPCDNESTLLQKSSQNSSEKSDVVDNKPPDDPHKSEVEKTVESCEKDHLSQSILPSTEVTNTDRFPSFIENSTISRFIVSADLSISSSSNSDVGELDSSKTNLTPTVAAERALADLDDQIKPISDQSRINQVELSQSSRDVPLKHTLVEKNPDVLDNTRAGLESLKKSTSDAYCVQQEVNKTTVKSCVTVDVETVSDRGIENPCSDSIICNSNSLHDILNLSGEKNKVTNVSYELFSLESIDKFAISPKKHSSEEPCIKIEFRHDNKIPEPIAKDQTSLKNESNAKKICKDPVVKAAHDVISNEILLNDKGSNNAKMLDQDTTPLQVSTPLEDGIEPQKDGLNSSKNGEMGQNVVSIHEDAIVSVTDRTVETFASNSVLISKKISKNGFKPIINPISSSWIKNHVKNRESITKVLEEKKCSDRTQNPSVSETKSDIVQSLFGSPVKWADSDSLDFIPPTIDKDPSIFEDSRSGSYGSKINEKLAVVNQSEMDIKIKKVGLKNVDEKIDSLFSSNPSKNNSVTSKTSCKISDHRLSSVTLPGAKILSSGIMKCVKYEDTTLGQFEDTLQFVSALSTIKKTVSPIGTPEKTEIESKTLTGQIIQPFSSVKINQKPEFKIVGPNEKPINILTPRRTPRIVSPKKLNVSGSSPNSADSKSCRISCIDDKAIESVCNLVSSIKETNHRETYLIIPKKSKTLRNNSPKKLPDVNDRGHSKTNASNLEKFSTVKIPNKTVKVSPTQKEVVKNVKSNVSTLKLSPKKKALLSLNNNLKSKDNAAINDSRNNDCLTSTSKLVSEKSGVKPEMRKIQLIDRMPLIPKLNNCTKVKMSYELKKPSRMNRKTDIKINEVNVKKSDVKNSVVTTPDNNAFVDKGEQRENLTDKLVECKNGMESGKQIQDVPATRTSSETPTYKKPSSSSELPPTINKHGNEAEIKSAKKDYVSCKSNGKSRITSLLTDCKGDNNSDNFQHKNDEMIESHISESVESKILSKVGNLVVQLEENIICTPTTVADTKVCRIQSKCTSDKPHDTAGEKSLNYQRKREELQEKSKNKKSRDEMSRSCDSKSLDRCSADMKSDYNFKAGSLKSSKTRNSSSSSSHSSATKKGKNLDSSTSKKEHLPIGKLTESKEHKHANSRDNVKSRERTRSHSQDSHYSSSRGGSKHRSHMKSRHLSGVYQSHFRPYRDHYNQPYRRRLTWRYSCYRRREPSVFSNAGGSPERNNRSRKYSYKYKHRDKNDDYLRSEERKQLTDKTNYALKESSSTRKESSLKNVSRNWGSSPVVTVSMSPRHLENTQPSNQDSYDRINGISCNNLVWRLIRVDGVPDSLSDSLHPEEKVTPCPMPAPTASPSKSPGSNLSSKIIGKKKTRNFSSSDVKTDFFSSSPMKSEDTSTVRRTESSVDTHTSDLQMSAKANQHSSLKRTHSTSKVSGIEQTSFPLEKSPVKSIGAHENKQSSTVTYRIPSFLKKSNDGEIKTVTVSRVKDKFCGVFSSPPDVQGVNEQYSEESNVSACSFTSDESWAPKKKRKKK